MNKLPIPPDDFMRQAFGQIERLDAMNRKRNEDIDLGMNRLIITSPNGTRYEIAVDNAGTLSTTLV